MRNNRSISRSSSNSEQSMLYNIVSASIETSIWYGECESSISWRAAETWYRHRPVDCRQVQVTASRPSLLRNHTAHIAGVDLFVVPTVGFKLLYGLVILRLERRRLVWTDVTANPTAEWIARQITEA